MRSDGVSWVPTHRTERTELTYKNAAPNLEQPAWIEQHARVVVELDYTVAGAEPIAVLPIKNSPVRRPLRVSLTIIDGELDRAKMNGPEVMRNGRDSHHWADIGLPRDKWPNWLWDLIEQAVTIEKAVASRG